MATAATSFDFLQPSPPEAAGEIGRLGHYRVIRQLGQGGMGYVFEAEDVKLERRVALKVMNQKIAATDGARARFITEARAMAAVRHDSVATIFEVGQHDAGADDGRAGLGIEDAPSQREHRVRRGRRALSGRRQGEDGEQENENAHRGRGGCDSNVR